MFVYVSVNELYFLINLIDANKKNENEKHQIANHHQMNTGGIQHHVVHVHASLLSKTTRKVIFKYSSSNEKWYQIYYYLFVEQ